MNKVYQTIKDNPLFSGVAISDFTKILTCMSAKTVLYKKDAVILLSGDSIDFVGIIISGGVRIVKEDENGNVCILTELSVPDVFGEVFACAGVDRSPVTILASEDSEILFIDYKRIITSCSAACPFHTRLIENMLKLVAAKNLALTQKIDILSKRTTREKLLAYFDAHRGAAKKFTIAFNREELANYLCVDRSAMSGELGKMRDEGIIRFKRNAFELIR